MQILIENYYYLQFKGKCNCVKETVGIFGGAGYIGSSIARHLKNRFEVKVFDLKKPLIEMSNIAFQTCDIRDANQVRECTKELDAVIHTAIIQIPMISEKKRLGYEVNYVGTQNICEAVNDNQRIKGLILSSSWHTIGEKKLTGLVNEEFGFRPDMVEERARLYALSKIAQECIVRYFSEMSDKTFGIIRMGTVLGEGMPEKTAANIFIDRGLKGLSITPYKHSMYRPMLYGDISDICQAYELFLSKILNDSCLKTNNSMDNIVNVYYPEPITIIDLAKMVQKIIINESKKKINPAIEVTDANQPMMFNENDKEKITVDVSKALKFLGLTHFKSPQDSIENIVKSRYSEASRGLRHAS
jgi:nucleoside-diphosphate-sugar epimerase